MIASKLLRLRQTHESLPTALGFRLEFQSLNCRLTLSFLGLIDRVVRFGFRRFSNWANSPRGYLLCSKAKIRRKTTSTHQGSETKIGSNARSKKKQEKLKRKIVFQTDFQESGICCFKEVFSEQTQSLIKTPREIEKGLHLNKITPLERMKNISTFPGTQTFQNYLNF